VKPTSSSEKIRFFLVQPISQRLKLHELADGPITRSYCENKRVLEQKLVDVIQTIGSEVSKEERYEISNIVEAAANLAMESAAQKSRIQTFSINADERVKTYDTADLDDRNLKNREDMEEETVRGMIELFISPGLERVGDARGGSLIEPPKVLSRAQVFMKIQDI
jgi:hypothetical protein